MKFAIAQTAPQGSIQQNVQRHLELLEFAINHNSRLIVFPELSLTGYEPTRAAELALVPDDPCLQPFKDASDRHGLSICLGAPTRAHPLPNISAMLIHPNQAISVHSKHYLHQDEIAHFSPGSKRSPIILESPKTALAICYELSVAEHEEVVFADQVEVYIASVAKTKSGMDTASQRLAKIAAENRTIVMAANCLGVHDGETCSGSSSVWNRQGDLLVQLNDETEGVIVLDLANETFTTSQA